MRSLILLSSCVFFTLLGYWTSQKLSYRTMEWKCHLPVIIMLIAQSWSSMLAETTQSALTVNTNLNVILKIARNRKWKEWKMQGNKTDIATKC